VRRREEQGGDAIKLLTQAIPLSVPKERKAGCNAARNPHTQGRIKRHHIGIIYAMRESPQ